MKHLLSYQKCGLILTVFIGFLLLGSIISIWLLSDTNTDTVFDSTQLIATISKDGTVLYEINLSQVSAPYNLTISSEDGNENVVHIEHNSVSMLSATCKDKLCVKMGAIQRSLLPIICLPNKVVIELKKSSPANNYDTITY